MRHEATLAKVTMFLLLIGGSASLGLAQATLQTTDHEEHGLHLVGSDGMSLYAFLPDADKEGSACTGDCVEAWPPLASTPGAETSEPLDSELLGTIVRDDGTEQVTYGGWPLYSFARDAEAGDAMGHGVGENWYLVAPDGSLIGTDASATGDAGASAETSPSEDAAGSTEGEPQEGAGEEQEAGTEAAAMGELMDTGENVYAANCAVCHGEEGDEALQSHVVKLAGNDEAVENGPRVVRQIVYGGGYMPAFGDELSNHEVAAVATFVRNSWGNEYGAITEEVVEEVRSQFE